MSLRKKKIERLADNMQYIKLGLMNDKGTFANAQWLLGTVETLIDDVVREDLQNAISERNRLNNGYSKAGH